MKESMYPYSPSEVEHALKVLNTAIKNHRFWFDSLHSSILCDLPFAEDILHTAAHKHCEFGKWYYSEAGTFIKSIKEYSELEPIHKYMHSYARDLALLTTKNKKIDEGSYNTFLNNQHQLITLLTQLRDTLIERSYCFDTVTGAANRRAASVMLGQIFEHARRYDQVYTLAMLDVDHFKKINDQFGHVAGDHVLKNIYMYFRNSLRKSDFIGRYGGEEFLILLPETSIEQALSLMNKCRTGMSDHEIIVGTESVKVTVSIGIAEIEDDDEDAWQAVKRADKVLYQAKDSGRNCVKQH